MQKVTKIDAIEYLTNRLSTDKEFAYKAMSELIYKGYGEKDTFNEAVTKWKSDNANSKSGETE